MGDQGDWIGGFCLGTPFSAGGPCVFGVSLVPIGTVSLHANSLASRLVHLSPEKVGVCVFWSRSAISRVLSPDSAKTKGRGRHPRARDDVGKERKGGKVEGKDIPIPDRPR
jgi:hypothetical protein